METIVGIKGKDFVMLAADSTHPHSIMVLKDGNNLCFTFLRVINSTMTCKINNFINDTFSLKMPTKFTRYPTH